MAHEGSHEQAFCDALDDMTSSLSSVREQISVLREKQTKASEADLKDGISLLNLKHHLLLSYMQSLVILNSRRALGHTLGRRNVPSLPFSSPDRDARGSELGDLADSLVENRLVQEKIKVLENKMRYQIQKLVRIAEDSTTEIAIDDPLAFRPNPQALMNADMSGEDDEEEPNGEDRQDGIYRPPKVAPMPYTELSGKDKRGRRAPIPTTLASLAHLDPSKPYTESTTGLGAAPTMQNARAREIQRMTEFEEENFTRLVLKKKDEKRRRKDEEDIALGGTGGISSRRRGGGFEDEFADVLKSVGRDRRSAMGDGYEELRNKGKRAGALARARSRSEVDDTQDDEPRQRKRSRFDKEVRVGKKRAAKSKR